VSQRKRSGRSKASPQLHEARGLVGAVAVDRAAEVARVVRDDAERMPFDADERGHHAEAEVATKLEDGPGIGERPDDRAHVVHRSRFSGTVVRSRRWSAHSHVATDPWK